LVDNTMVYQVPFEAPATVIKLSPPDEQRQLLQKEFEAKITDQLVNGNREERARAAYMAICLDMNIRLAKSNSKQWKTACNDLSGYWKIMNNIFFGDFKSLKLFQEKFEKAGFRIPPKAYSDNEMYNDKVSWKDPKGLY